MREEMEVMPALDIENVCRVCLQRNLELFLIFDENYSVDGICVSDMLTECTRYEVKRFDEFPHLICSNCMESVKNAYKFKKQCEKSYRKIIDMLNNTKGTYIDPNRIQNPQLEKATQTDSSTLYPCEKCDEKFFNYETLREHRLSVHKGSANECRFCCKKFNRINHLKSHIAAFHPETGCSSFHYCSVCKKQFTRKDHVKRHMKNVHKIDFPNIDEKSSLDEPEIEYKIENDEQQNADGVQLPDNDPTSLPTPSSSSSSTSVCGDDDDNDEEDNEVNANELDNDKKIITKLLVQRKMDDFLINSKDEDEKDDKNGIILPMILDEEVKSDFPKVDELPECIDIKKEKDTTPSTIEEVNFFMDNSMHPIVEINETINDNCNAKKTKRPTIVVNKKKHVCSQCDKVFTRSNHLKRHMVSHGDEKPFACGTCSKRFKRVDHLKNHLTLHREPNLQCDECGQSFRRRDKLNEHKRLKHSDNPAATAKVEICSVCQKGFSSKSYLRRHLASHYEKRYNCRHCEMGFVLRDDLKEHMKTHSKIKPFLCSECGISFLRNDYLLIHMRRHKGEKPYKCKFCNKGFPRATDLNIHEKYHTGDKPHLCTVCGKGFHRSYNLVVHMRVHTGERPYKCSHCPRSFAQGNDLKAHIRRHTGERFKCATCGEGFIQGYNLTQHMFTVHGIEVKPRNGGRVAKFQSPKLKLEPAGTCANDDDIEQITAKSGKIEKAIDDKPFNLSTTEQQFEIEHNIDDLQ